MKKYLKIISALLAVVGCLLMFGTQVVVKWATGVSDAIGVNALVDGEWQNIVGEFDGAYSGLAGYILLGCAALIFLLIAFTSIKEHDILSVVLTGIAVIALIVGIILIFTIRKSFMDANGLLSKQVYVGWGAIAAGSCGSLAILSGLLSMVFDLNGNN